MYSTKQFAAASRTFTNDKREFLAVGEKYKDPDRVIPVRWKGKQLIVPTPKKPSGTGVGYFNPTTYKPEPYVDRNPYIKTQPLDSRKLGFGSHNAKCRDEFMSHIRTEQYREQLKAELKLTSAAAASDPSALVTAGDTITSPGRFPKRHAYDVMKDDRSPRSVYNTRDIAKGKKHLGSATLSSADIGTGIPETEHKPPEFASTAATRAFYHTGHIG